LEAVSPKEVGSSPKAVGRVVGRVVGRNIFSAKAVGSATGYRWKVVGSSWKARLEE
jgi:hypothetical protein